MHTWSIRLYSLFGFAVSASVALLFAMHFASYTTPLSSTQAVYRASLSQPIVRGTKRAYNSIGNMAVLPAHDEMNMNISLAYNFTGLFNWNTKQVYTAVIAVYNDTSGLQRQTVWDKVVTRNHKRVYNGTVTAIYPLHSYNLQNSLGNIDKMDFELYTQVMPYAGFFRERRHIFANVPIVHRER